MQVFDRSTPFAPRVLWAVATGGAIGAAGRWSVNRLFDWFGACNEPGAWPWSTLAVNVIGSILIGFAARQIVRGTTAWAFVVTGLLGGFTTFSALAIELNELADADAMPLAILYGAVTLCAGVAATAIADLGRGST